MPPLTARRIAELLQPYLYDGVSEPEVVDMNQLTGHLEVFLDLLVRWNSRTNLTAIREPETMVTRHFGESIFAARALSPGLHLGETLLDFGSGAGFPGLPMQLYRPDLRVTLAESQGKKASFLREAVRTLGLATEVWSSRVEAMQSERKFDCVILRAVDNMESALPAAINRVGSPGRLAILGGAEPAILPQTIDEEPPQKLAMPGGERSFLYVYAL